MDRENFTAGIFSIPFSYAFIEDHDGEIVPNFKSLKRFAALLSDYGLFRLKLISPDSGQLGELTETGYHDGVLGLMQRAQADACFYPLPLDTQRAPGLFVTVLDANQYYIISFLNTEAKVESIYSSLKSTIAIPILLAAFALLFVKMITIERWNRTSLSTIFYNTWSSLFSQHASNRASWRSLVQIIILMLPMLIFNASFNTQAIIRNTDAKIETLRDIVTYDKIPVFYEGLSMYDLFKAQVTRDYRDVYKQAELKGTGQPFKAGPIPSFEVPFTQITGLTSGSILGLASVFISSIGVTGPNQEMYISEKPFHSSLKSFLLRNNITIPVRNKIEKIALRAFQAGIVKKIEADIYNDFALSVPGFEQITEFDLSKKDMYQKVIDLYWNPLKLSRFMSISYILMVMLFLITIIQIIEMATFKLIYNIKY